MRHRLLALLGGVLLSACAGSRAAGPAGPSTTAAGPVQTRDQAADAPSRAGAERAVPSPAAAGVPSTPVGTRAAESAGGSTAAATDEPGNAAGPGASSTRRPPPRSGGPLAEGIAAFRSGRWPQAADAFRSALRDEPDDVDAQFNLALTEERLGASDRARSAYQAALRLDPDHLPSLVNLARLERQTGRAERAAQLLESASRRAALASEPALWVQLSMTERVTGNLADAESAARRALSLRRDPGAYEALALVASARGQDREAELLATSALRLDEARASTHVTLGLVAYRLGEVGRARAEFDRAAALDPSSADAWANLGALALGWRDYAGAERAYGRATEIEPWAVDSRLHLAEALLAQAPENAAKATAAAAAYREVLARAPDRAEAICGAGWALAQEQRAAAEAGRLLRRCRELPDTSQAERRRIDGRLSVLDALARGPAGAEPASSRVGGSGAREQVGGTGGSR
jgi:tetratricopeptide (TPR) repeat protein